MTGTIGLNRTERTARITLDRPDRKNALTSAMTESLIQCVHDLASDDSIDVIVMDGAGTDFCAGSDLGDIASVLSSEPVDRTTRFATGMETSIQPLARALLGLRQPLVVSARGHAIGIGVLFLLAADLVVASDTLRVTVPQVKLGHTMDHGESWLLPRKVGLAKAMQIALLGDRLGAVDAERCGLVNWVTPDADLQAKTSEVVDGLLAVAPIPLLRSKALLTASLEASLDEQLRAETESASTCAGTADFVEAISAQIERRTPKFIGA